MTWSAERLLVFISLEQYLDFRSAFLFCEDIKLFVSAFFLLFVFRHSKDDVVPDNLYLAGFSESQRDWQPAIATSEVNC
jgi:hypothetical protein